MARDEAVVLEIRERMAVEVRNRIRADAAKVPWPYRGVLEEIGRDLFDADLRLLKIYGKLKQGDAAISSKFVGHLGLSPNEYLTECRMEVAAEMLRAAEGCTIEQVALAIGYSSASAFTVAFKAFFGCSPGQLRGHLRSLAEKGVDLDPKYFRKSYWWEARWGRGLPTELWHYCEAIRLGALDDKPVLSLTEASTEAIEKAIADDIAFLVTAEPERLTGLGSGGLRFTTPALFERLLTLSRELGRQNRDLGVQIAERALESLHQLTGVIPEQELAGLEARGWAWVGNVRRLALDIEGAEIAFMRAEGLVAASGQARIEAEVLYLRLGMLLFQNRFEDALQLAVSLLKLSHSLSDELLAARCQLDVATVHYQQGHIEVAVTHFLEVVESASKVRDRLVGLAAYSGLILSYLELDQVSDAWTAWEGARQLKESTEIETLQMNLRWLEGLLWVKERRFNRALATLEEARAGYLNCGDRAHAALIALYIAEVHIETGRHRLVTELALEAIAVFEELRIDRETILSIDLLRRSIEQEQLSKELLKRTRDSVLRAIDFGSI